MKVQAILVIANVPSLLQPHRKRMKGAYQSYGYPVEVWELIQNGQLEWVHSWNGFIDHYYTTNHAKKVRRAHKLHMETGLPIIHINKERTAQLNERTKTMSIYDVLYIPFRKNDLCLK